jgi:hypothetical protein
VYLTTICAPRIPHMAQRIRADTWPSVASAPKARLSREAVTEFTVALALEAQVKDYVKRARP